ncbi:hypothetical protein [Shinella sp.]|jgi:hypothetical protein|uniref:hypothetical protein n=1 Tax=Shinella sp. TaxID=1870904 RepID=UPI0029C0C6FA|nr:hypothetical protein [Shinella sp.]
MANSWRKKELPPIAFAECGDLGQTLLSCACGLAHIGAALFTLQAKRLHFFQESPMKASEPKAERVAVWAANVACVIISFLLVFPLLAHFV